jgi:hypothetical protein
MPRSRRTRSREHRHTPAAAARRACHQQTRCVGRAPSRPGARPAAASQFYNPRGIATWLATDIDSDGDALAGLVDFGRGCPERSLFGLRALAALRLPEGITIARDPGFVSFVPLSIWADAARAAGSILWVEIMLRPPAASAAARRFATAAAWGPPTVVARRAPQIFADQSKE